MFKTGSTPCRIRPKPFSSVITRAELCNLCGHNRINLRVITLYRAVLPIASGLWFWRRLSDEAGLQIEACTPGKYRNFLRRSGTRGIGQILVKSERGRGRLKCLQRRLVSDAMVEMPANRQWNRKGCAITGRFGNGARHP